MNFVALIRSPSGIVVLETILVGCLTFGTFSVLVRVTDMETVGLWVLVSSLLGFSRAADFWSRGLASFVAEARGHKRNADAVAFVSTAVFSGVAGYAVLGAMGGLVVWVFAGSLADPANAARVRGIVPLMAVTFWLLAIAGTYGGAFLAFARPGLKSAHTVGGALVFLLLAVLLAPAHGLWGILIAQAVQAALVLLSSAVVFHVVVAGGALAWWRREQFGRLVAYGSKAIILGFLNLAIEPVIRLLASQFGGLGAVAAVELASRLIAVVRSLITALGQILVPQFARLGAAAESELRALCLDSNRLFLLASISAFSLLATAAPAAEELVLGESGTDFVVFLWLLAIGWFANTITAPTHFLLLGQRRLRPLFWSLFVMSAGAIVLGVAGGILAGVEGAIAGAAAALVASALYLAVVAGENGGGLSDYARFLKAEPSRLMPVLAAITAVAVLENLGQLDSDSLVWAGSNTVAITATIVTCLVFGDIRGLVQTAVRFR